MRLSALIAFASIAASSNADDAFFREKVEPLLAEHCIDCHSGTIDDVGGGLWLDHARGLLLGGDSGPAVKPHDVDGSPLIAALRYDGVEMPPDGKLAADEIAIFEKWVRDGAADPRDVVPEEALTARSDIDIEAGRSFWAFQKPVRSPDIAATPAGVDAAIRRALTDAGLPSAKQAPPATQLRRLYYTLTGLPPSPELQAAFAHDPSDEHYERIVDDLLGSPQFGEHWGRHWLDVARYADSNGSDFNVPFPNAWRYRNYVIRSFNEDKPYDEFVAEQIAGDLRSYPTADARRQAIIATGFLALGPKMLSERDKLKLKMDVVDEQIDSTGKAFLGMTLGCARCHDHKFDPIPQTDYYALAGIFTSTETITGEIQRYVSDYVRRPLPVEPEVAAARASYEARVAELERELTAIDSQLEAIGDTSELGRILKLGTIVDNDQAIVTGRWKESTYSKTRIGANYLHNDGKPDAGSVRYPAKLKPGRYDVRLSYHGAGGRAPVVQIEVTTAAGVEEATLNESKAGSIAGLFESIGKYSLDENATVTIFSRGAKGYVLADAVQFVPVDAVHAVTETPTDSAVSDLANERTRVKEQLERLRENAPPALPFALSVVDVETPADCAMRIRGEVHLEGDPVPRGVLNVAHTDEPPVFPSDSSGRLELANWIANESNPLTARVMVNRIWSHVFGEGLVRTPDNFGLLGQRPSHPALLDTLAIDFMSDDWSVKTMVRRLVLTQTFRQTSIASSGREQDIENRLLWRANRRPLSSEELRDTLLDISGQLDRTPAEAGLASPPKIIRSAPKIRPELAAVRTVYRPVVRTLVSPSATVFDFADPDVVMGKRPLTNVPSQALFLLNSPDVRDAAERVAERSSGATDVIYRIVFAREPSATEVERFEAFARETSLVDAIHAMLASTEFRLIE